MWIDNHYAPGSDPITPTSPLTIVKSLDPVDKTAVQAGGQVNYTIKVTNTSSEPVENVTVTDVLDKNLTFVMASIDRATMYTRPKDDVYNIGTVPAKGSVSVYITATVNRNTAPGTVINNQAALSDGQKSKNVPVTVMPGVPDLTKFGVRIVCDPQTSGHATAVYSPVRLLSTTGLVTVNTDEATKEQYPYTCAVSINPTQQEKWLAYAIKGSETPWNQDHKLADSTKTLTATFYYDGTKWTLPTGNGMNPDVVAATSDTGADSFNCLVIHTVHKVEPAPVLTIEKKVQLKKGDDWEDDPTIVKTGSTVKYTITVTNTGTAAATNVVVTDKLPDGLKIDAESMGNGSYTPGNRTVTWNLGTVAATNGRAEVSFEAVVTASGNAEVANVAKVASTEITTPEESEPAVIKGVNMVIKTTKGHKTITVANGAATIPYEVTVTNNGDPLYGLDIIDKLTEIKVTDKNGNRFADEVQADVESKVTLAYTDVKVNGVAKTVQWNAQVGKENAVTAVDRNTPFAPGKDAMVTLTYNITVKNGSDKEVMVSLKNSAMGGSWAAMSKARTAGDYDITDSDTDSASVGGSSTSVVIPPAQGHKVTIHYVDEKDAPISGKSDDVFYADKDGAYNVTDKIAAPGGYAIISIAGNTQGTTNTDVTITVKCGVDAYKPAGPDDPTKTDGSDGIPDMFQPVVTYKVVNGTWDSTSRDANLTYVYNLKVLDDQGNLVDANPAPVFIRPAATANTDKEYDNGAWGTDTPADTTPVTDAMNGKTYTLTFTAKDTYTVTFDSNGGGWEDGKTEQQITAVNGKVTLPDPAPTNPSGEVFMGWNTKPDGTGEAFTADTPVTKDMRVYAVWGPGENYVLAKVPFVLGFAAEDRRGIPLKPEIQFQKDDISAFRLEYTYTVDGKTYTGTLRSTDVEPERRALPVGPGYQMNGALQWTWDDFRVWVKKGSVSATNCTTVTFTMYTGESDTVGVAIPGYLLTMKNPFDVGFAEDYGRPAAREHIWEYHKLSMEIEKSTDKADFKVGEDITYTIALKNTERYYFYAKIVDALPEGLEYQGASAVIQAADGTETESTVTKTGNEYSFSTNYGPGCLLGGQTLVLKITAKVGHDAWVKSAATDRKITNTATAVTTAPVFVEGQTTPATSASDEAEVTVGLWEVTASRTDANNESGAWKDGDTEQTKSLTPDDKGIITLPAADDITPPTGKTLEKWVDQNGKEYLPGATIDTDGLTENLILTPVWRTAASTDVYTLSYNPNGGSGAPVSQSVTAATGSARTATVNPTTPYRSGYTFQGWSLYTNGTGTRYYGGNTITLTGNTVLYAIWSYNGGGGGGTGGGTTTINDGAVPLAGDLQLNKTDHFAYIKGYQDGTVRPNNPLTRAQVATIFYRLLDETSRIIYFQETNDFTDVADDFWACKAISTLTNAGIITGFQDGTFRPNAYITRAQFAAIAARFDNVVPGLENPFSDVSEDYWARDLIAYAASKGWIEGESGKFRPLENITRVEAMDFINNVLDRHVDEKGILAGATTFTDVPVTDPNYYVVEEATNSHDYTRRTDGQLMENWTKLNPDPVWDE